MMWPFEKKKKPLSFEEFQSQKSSGTLPEPEPSQGGVLSFEQFKANKQSDPRTQAPGFDEFQQNSPALGFDEFVKPAKTPIAQPKPVDQIEHEMSFGEKLKSTGLGFLKSGEEGLSNIGTALKSKGQAWQQPDQAPEEKGIFQKGLEMVSPALKLGNMVVDAAESTGIPGKVRNVAGKGLEALGGATERVYGGTAKKIGEDPAFDQNMASFRGKDGRLDPAKFTDPWTYISTIASGVGSFIPGAAVGLATKNPYAAGATMGLMEKGDAVQSYAEQMAKDKGVTIDQLSPEDLKRIDVTSDYYGVSSAVLESAFPGLLNKIIKEGGGSIIKNTLRSIPAEGGTEGIQRFTQNLISKVGGINPNQDLSEGVIDEAIAGALTGVAITAPTAALTPNVEENKTTPKDTVTPPAGGTIPDGTEKPKVELPGTYKPKKNVRTFFDALESGDEEQVTAVSEKMSKKELEDTQRVLNAIKDDSETNVLTPEKLISVEDHLDRVASLIEQKTTNISNEAKRIASGQPKTEKTPNLHISDQEQVKKVIEKVSSAVAPEKKEAIKKQLESDINTNKLPGIDEAQGLLNESNPFNSSSSISEMEDIYQEILVKNDARRGELDTRKNELLGQKKATTDRTEKQNIQKLIDDLDGERRNLSSEERIIEEQAQAKQLSIAQETIDKIRVLEPNFNVSESVDTNWGMEDYQTYLDGLNNKKKPYGANNSGATKKQGIVSGTKPVGRGKPKVSSEGTSKYAEKTGGDASGSGEQPGERSSERQSVDKNEKSFEITLSSGEKVQVKYSPDRFGQHHFEFRGKAISNTGYRSHFVLGQEKIDNPEEYALEAAEHFSKEGKKGKTKEIKKSDLGIPMVDAVSESNKKEKKYSKKEIEDLALSKDTFTEEEKSILAQYEGAGANRAEGRGLLDEFFTPESVVEKSWRLVESYLPDTKNLKVLEPAVGTGRFLKYAPKGSDLYAFETNPVSAKIAQVLHPGAKVTNASFETLFIDEKGKKKSFEPTYDVVIGNPPYGTHRGKYKGLGEEKKLGRYEEYFIKRSLDLTKEDGIVAMVIPSGFLRGGFDYAKQQIAMRGYIIDAYRLPNASFKGTEVGTDIVIIRKHYYPSTNDQIDGRPWTDDNFFKENPDKVLGTSTQKKGRFGMEDVVEGKLEDALNKIVIDREVAKEIATDEVEETKEQEELEHVLPMKEDKPEYGKQYRLTGKDSIADGKTWKEAEVLAETEAILKPSKRQPKDEKGKMERKKDTPYLIVSEKKDKTQIISQSIATEEQQYLFKNTLEDGSIDPGASFEKSEVNYQYGKYYTDFNYLQGNIYEKLKRLEMDKEKLSEAQYSRQKKALENALPDRMSIRQISIVPLDEMMKMKLGDRTLSDHFIEWMKTLPYNAFEGSSSWNIMGYMNGEVVNVGDKARNREIKKQRREVGNRIFKKFYTEELDEKYQKMIEDSFNERYNGIVRPDYSQYPFSVELNQKFYGKPLNLRPIQIEGASFLVNKGAGLLAYEVGVGKTLAGIAAISEVIRRGWSTRPLIVVPKNLRTKWIRDIMESLPKAKVNDLGNLGRDLKFDGDWKDFTIEEGSISIITEEGFKRLGFAEETYTRLTKSLQDTTYSLKEKSARAKAAEDVKAEEIAGMARRGTDFPITFENLGFDHITFDEAHREKNVFASADVKKTEGGGSKRANEYGAVRGAVSERGLKAYLATQYILEQNNGRNVFLLTATPFNNSPIEIYSILSLMAKKRLEEMGIKNINQFISLFVELENRLAIKANGAILEVDQVRKFQNLQQLQRLVTEYIDFRTGEEAGVPRPQKIRRKPAVKMTKLQAELVELSQGLFLDKEAGVLKAINELQKIALSPLLSQFSDKKVYSATPKEVVETSPKIRYAVEAIKKAHQANPKAGQIIFIEKGVEVFEPIRQYFIKELGYKPSEVAILDGSVKDAMRDEIQSKFQSGGVRILMTTIKEGIDLQERSTDLYNLYLPWNPTDLLQIEGRTWRQGSIYDKVRIHYPLLENSIDSFMFQKLEEKAARLESVFSYKGNDLDVSDIDFEAVKFELITDPVKRVEAEYAYLEGQTRKKINLLKAEMSFTMRKADRLNTLRNELRDMTGYRDRAVKDNDASDTLYYDNRVKKVKVEIEAERERLKKSGIDIADIETRANEKQQELLTAESEQETLSSQKEEKKTAVAGQGANITFGDTDFDEVTKDMADRGFFKEMSYQKMTPRELQYLKEYGGGRVNENVIIGGYPQTVRIGERDSILTNEATKIFRRFFTEEEYPLEVMNRIVSEDGGEAWGMTAPEMVAFVVNPKESTPYHEAVHAYIKKYVTKAQWNQIIDEIKEKAGRKEMSSIEAEEMLADQFIYYVKERENALADQRVSPKVKRFFYWVIEQIKRLVGKQNKIDQFYEALMDKKRPGFIQRVQLSIDRNPDIFKGTKYQDMTSEDDNSLISKARKFDKVEDFIKSQGSPVYHGTLEKFDAFDIGKSGSFTGWDNSKFGIFFLDDKKRAEEFPDLARMSGDRRPVNVKEAYINLKNPIDLTLTGIFNKENQASLLVKILSGETMGPKEALESLNENIGLGEIGELSEALYGDIENKSLMKEAGFDGIVSDYGDGVIEKVVFDQSQVKTRSQLVAIWEKSRKNRYQEMTPEESERARMHAIVARAFDKVFAEKRPPSLGKMLEEEFVNKDRRTMLTAERLEAITENIADIAMTEGKQAGYLEAETSVILGQEEKIKELVQKLKDQDYKNNDDRIKLKERIGTTAHERLLSIVKLYKKMERQAEVASNQKARIQARFEEKKEILKDKQKMNIRKQKDKFKSSLKELQAIRDEMYEYVKEHLPRKRWAKFLTTMRDAKTRNRLKSVFEAVDEEVVRIQREEAVRNIKRVLQHIEELPLQYQMLIEKITSGINWKGALPSTIKKLGKVKAYLESHPEASTSFPMHILKRLNILENKSYKYLTTEQLMGINAKLEMIMSVGENAKLISKGNLMKEKAEKLALIQQTSQNFDIIKQSGITREEREKMTLWEKGLDKLQTTEFQLMPMDFFFLHWLDGDNEGGPNYSLLKRPIEDGFSQYWKLSNKIKGSVFDFINEMKNKGMETSDDMWDRIGMYAIRVQKGGTAKLLGSGYSKEQIDAVTLNENELALYGYLRKELDQMFPMIQEVYARVHNVQLEGVDDYFPFLMDWSNRAPVYQELEAQYNNKKGVSGQGFTVSRVGGKNPVRVNALESFLKHIDQAAYFIAMEERVRDARDIVSDKRYQLAVGEKAQAYLMRWLEVIERHGVPVDDKSIPFIDGVRRNITLGVLAFKLTTIPIQYTAVFNGAAHIGKYAFTGFTEIVTSKEAREFVVNASEQMKMRVGDSPEYREEIPNAKLEKAKEIGMWAIKKSDMQTASGVWLGAYKMYMDNHGLEFSMEDVNVEAQSYADRIVRMTQGSAEYKDLPPAMAQKYRTLGKLLLQFQTFAIYQYSYVRSVVGPNVSKDPKVASWQFAMIATNILLVMQIRDLISRAIWGAPDNEDEEGLISKFAWELVQSVPLLGGQLYQVHRFMNSPTLYTALNWQSGVPVIDKAMDVPRSIALAAIAKKEGTQSKNIVKAGEAAGSLMGLPGATQAGQIWRSFIE